jgi:two-component system response regulator HydG
MKTTARMEKILIVGSDTNYMYRLSKILTPFIYRSNRLEVLSSVNEEEMQMQLMKNPDIKLILLDNAMEHNELKHILGYIKEYPIIIIAEQVRNIPGLEIVNKQDIDEIKNHIAAKLDDYDKITKDSEISKTSLRLEIEYLMGKGKVISEVLDQVEKYAKIDKSILIEGETGTGKELIANYLYKLSTRKNMVTVNCGILNKELAASELFGSVKGAFTDARNRQGKVETADGGMLFLDELNSLSPDVQVKLLRFIEYGTYSKVGDTAERKANVRIIAASNKSIKEMVEKGEFRQDMYARFVKIIHIPTLNERIEDMDYFIDRFISEENKTLCKTASISDKARQFLIRYEWSENIRQLKNLIETLVVEVEPDKSSKKHIIQIPLILECLNERQQNKSDGIRENDYTLQTARDNATKKAIRQALEEAKGNNDEAIKLLDISHKQYYNLKKKLKI